MTDDRPPIDRANEVKFLLNSGAISYDEARERLAPILEEMNVVGREIAKRHKRKFYGFSPVAFLR